VEASGDVPAESTTQGAALADALVWAAAAQPVRIVEALEQIHTWILCGTERLGVRLAARPVILVPRRPGQNRRPVAFQPSAFSEGEPKGGLANKLAGGWRRLIGRPPGGASRWNQTAWQRAAADTSTLGGRGVLFMLVGAPIFGAAGANLLPFEPIFWRSLVGALIGLAAAVAVVLVLMISFWLRAPYKQRDEARAMIREADDLRNLVYLRDYLRQTLDANTRILEDLGKSGRTGPIADDDDPWIRRQNEETRRQLEMLGFPDLVPEVVLDELQLGTWEGVADDAERVSRRLAEARADPRFHVMDRL
jgi:hypothetical protein